MIGAGIETRPSNRLRILLNLPMQSIGTSSTIKGLIATKPAIILEPPKMDEIMRNSG